MVTSTNNISLQVKAKHVRCDSNTLHITLNDDREISLPIERYPWLKWLADATAQQRAKWKIEPSGFAIYWDELDDGIEVEHLLSLNPLA